MTLQEILLLVGVPSVISLLVGGLISFQTDRRLKRLEIEHSKQLARLQVELEADLKDKVRFREKRFEIIQRLGGSLGKIKYFILSSPTANEDIDLIAISKVLRGDDLRIKSFIAEIEKFVAEYYSNSLFLSEELCTAVDGILELLPMYGTMLGGMDQNKNSGVSPSDPKEARFLKSVMINLKREVDYSLEMFQIEARKSIAQGIDANLEKLKGAI